jgi:hypothetical protein
MELIAMAGLFFGYSQEYVEMNWSAKKLKFMVRKAYKWQVLSVRQGVLSALR